MPARRLFPAFARNRLYPCLIFSWVLSSCGDAPIVDEFPPDTMPQADLDCPPELDCETIPAAYALSDAATGSYGNYDLANRPADGLEIRYIVIHDTDTQFDDAVKLFADPSKKAAAHYVIRSSDGHVVKMVEPKHVAWHAGNWYFNMHSIGIEHSGWAFEGHRWYSDAMYRASAKLVRFLAARYKIPLDRAHILGHEEVPGGTAARQQTMHWDPGPYFDWDYYMRLVTEAELDAPPDSGQPGVIAVHPDLAKNRANPQLTYCFSSDETMNCGLLPEKPVNFLFLRQAPDFAAPLLANPYLSWPPERVYNWGNRAVAGQLYYRVERQGDWDAISFSGEKAWFWNPGLMHTRAALGVVVTPRAGLSSVPVYGFAYPGDAAFMPPLTPPTLEKIYELVAGQRYVARTRMSGDFYFAKTYSKELDPGKNYVIKDSTDYYAIDWNHRFAFVKASDVDEVP